MNDQIPDWKKRLLELLAKSNGEGIPEDISFITEDEQYRLFVKLERKYSNDD